MRPRRLVSPSQPRYSGAPTRQMCFVAVHESGCGRYCCKSPKLPGTNFSGVKKSDLRPPMDVASITLRRSPVSLSSGDEVPHIFTRKSRLRPKEFLITSAKRLLQQNRHKAAEPKAASLRQLFGGAAEVHGWTAPIAFDANDPSVTLAVHAAMVLISISPPIKVPLCRYNAVACAWVGICGDVSSLAFSAARRSCGRLRRAPSGPNECGRSVC
jgi:hypothetical protein